MQTNFIALIQTATHWPVNDIKIITEKTNRQHVYLKIRHAKHNYLATGSLIAGQTKQIHVKPLFSPYGTKNNWLSINEVLPWV